jgi:hypothetical protein
MGTGMGTSKGQVLWELSRTRSLVQRNGNGGKSRFYVHSSRICSLSALFLVCTVRRASLDFYSIFFIPFVSNILFYISSLCLYIGRVFRRIGKKVNISSIMAVQGGIFGVPTCEGREQVRGKPRYKGRFRVFPFSRGTGTGGTGTGGLFAPSRGGGFGGNN